jgi:Uma2 family endonuclease
MGRVVGRGAEAHRLSHRSPHNARHHASIRAPGTYTCHGACRLLIEIAMHADTAVRTEPSAPADPAVAREELVRLWDARPLEEDSPDRYELNEFGEWIVTPRPAHEHQQVAAEIVIQIVRQLGPRAVTEVSVFTDRGIRVPDVAWMPAARWLEVKGQNPLALAPDVCVEVLSPRNTREEILMKVNAYLRAGAREAIVVGLKGEIEFFDPQGKLEVSALGVKLELPPELF